MGAGLIYEARKLEARLEECERAFEVLREKARECSEALRGLEEGKHDLTYVLGKLSGFLEALGDFQHELSHLASSAASILARAGQAE